MKTKRLERKRNGEAAQTQAEEDGRLCDDERDIC